MQTPVHKFSHVKAHKSDVRASLQSNLTEQQTAPCRMSYQIKSRRSKYRIMDNIVQNLTKQSQALEKILDSQLNIKRKQLH